MRIISQLNRIPSDPVRARSTGEGAGSQGCKLAGAGAERHTRAAPRQPPAKSGAGPGSVMENRDPAAVPVQGADRRPAEPADEAEVAQALLQLENPLRSPLLPGEHHRLLPEGNTELLGKLIQDVLKDG